MGTGGREEGGDTEGWHKGGVGWGGGRGDGWLFRSVIAFSVFPCRNFVGLCRVNCQRVGPRCRLVVRCRRLVVIASVAVVGVVVVVVVFVFSVVVVVWVGGCSVRCVCMSREFSEE